MTNDSASAERDELLLSAYERLFRANFRKMTALAVMLGADDPENIVQEAFARIYERPALLADSNGARAYVRISVVNLTRSRLRHLSVVRQHRSSLAYRGPVMNDSAGQVVERSAMEIAVRALKPRQREAIVLRYWLDLSESGIAEAMNVSVGTVKAHLSRGLAALRVITVQPQESR